MFACLCLCVHSALLYDLATSGSSDATSTSTTRAKCAMPCKLNIVTFEYLDMILDIHSRAAILAFFQTDVFLLFLSRLKKSLNFTFLVLLHINKSVFYINRIKLFLKSTHNHMICIQIVIRVFDKMYNHK